MTFRPRNAASPFARPIPRTAFALVLGFALIPCQLSASPAATRPAAAASAPVADIGEFPHLNAPAGYRFGDAKRLSFEQKHMFPAGKMQLIEGPYFHADIFADGGEWNETLLLRDLDRQIAALGGKTIYDGTLPDAATKVFREEQPRSVKDLYDPWPYRYRHYLIETSNKKVWIEIGYGYNAQMVDLTVVEEAPAV